MIPVGLAHGGDRIATVLQRHGVRHVFTLCGGHVSPILTGAKARGIRVVDVRDEATAVFAADATSRLTGSPGVAVVTAGPGVANTITALKNAQLAQSPLVLFGGAAPTALQGRGALQDIDQRALVSPHVKHFRKVRTVRELEEAAEEAFELSREGVPGPAFVECPVDLLYDEKTIRSWYQGASGKGTSLPDRLLRLYLQRHVDRMLQGSQDAAFETSPRRDAPPPSPAVRDVANAAAALAKAERPLLVIGSQALVLALEAERVAAAVRRLGIPAYLSGMARGLLGREHHLLMRHQRRQALRESDCVVLAGVPCDFRLDYGKHIRRSATLIAANRSPKEARKNRRPDIAAIGDAGLFLEQLAGSLGDIGKRLSPWIETLRARDLSREREIDEEAREEGELVNPLALLQALDREAGEDAILVADGGDFVGTASYVVRARGPLSWLDPGVFGTLGVGAGFALGAALCQPGREVWILFGDGACGFSLVEFDTFVRHGIPVIAVVGNDAGWTQIAREQVKMLGDDVGTVLTRSAYHEVATAFGGQGLLVKKTQDIPDALRQARATARSGRSVLVNVWLEKTRFREGSLSM